MEFAIRGQTNWTQEKKKIKSYVLFDSISLVSNYNTNHVLSIYTVAGTGLISPHDKSHEYW